MRYPPEFIDKVTSASNIADIISQHTELKPAGRDLVGRCPFPDHKEKTPSFHVSPDKQLYHCFGCKKGGNVFTFLKDFNGMSFKDSLEYLAQRARIPLPKLEVNSAEQDKKQEKKKYVGGLNKAATFYFTESFKRLPPQHPVRVYVRNRKLSDESIEIFKLGYASEEWDGLARFLDQKKFNLAIAEEAGLIKSRKEKTGYYDLFRHRLMFTIMNPLGEPIGFGGRVLDDAQPKYLNSPETLLFHKGKALYGIHATSKFIRSQDQAIVVEGYMDLISMYQAGIRNVVAPLGTALTLEQAQYLVRITRNVVVLFDGDEAGQAAAERSLPILLQAGSLVRGLFLPEEQDPDEYISQHGVESLKTLIDSAEDLFFLILKKWMLGYRGDVSDKMRLVQKLKPLFSSMTEASLYELYVVETSKKMGVDRTWLKQALVAQDQGFQQRPAPRPHPTQVAVLPPTPPQKEGTANAQIPVLDEVISIKGAPKAELLLLSLGLNSNGQIWDQILHTDLRECFHHKGIKQVLEKVEQLTRQERPNSATLVSLLTTEIKEPDLISAVIIELPKDPDAEAKLLSDCIRKVRIHHLDLQVKHLAQEMKTNPSAEKYEQLLNLQRDRMQWARTQQKTENA